MASRIASTILTRTNSMKRAKLRGLGKTIQATLGSDGGYESNDYIHKDFFEGENYQSILKCLEEGYGVFTDLIEYMQDYCNLLQAFSQSLTAYSTKWQSKLNHQPTISSYNTTKQAQTQTVSSSLKLAQLIQTRCDAIELVIASFRRQVDRVYPGERFGTVHKHYRADVLRRQFKAARAPLLEVSEKLEELHEQEKKAQKSLLEAQIECQNLGLDESTSKTKLAKANDRLEKKQEALQVIQSTIARTKDERDQTQKTYRQKATGIYQQYRELEAERLNLIRETLIEFIQAKHTTEHSSEQEKLYSKLLAQIDSEQNTDADLDFWARTYHVNTLSRLTSLESESNQSQSRKSENSPKTERPNLTTVEAEEDQPVADKAATAPKGKQKQKKTTTTETN